MPWFHSKMYNAQALSSEALHSVGPVILLYVNVYRAPLAFKGREKGKANLIKGFMKRSLDQGCGNYLTLTSLQKPSLMSIVAFLYNLLCEDESFAAGMYTIR